MFALLPDTLRSQLICRTGDIPSSPDANGHHGGSIGALILGGAHRRSVSSRPLPRIRWPGLAAAVGSAMATPDVGLWRPPRRSHRMRSRQLPSPLQSHGSRWRRRQCRGRSCHRTRRRRGGGWTRRQSDTATKSLKNTLRKPATPGPPTRPPPPERSGATPPRPQGPRVPDTAHADTGDQLTLAIADDDIDDGAPLPVPLRVSSTPLMTRRTLSTRARAVAAAKEDLAHAVLHADG
ncbi:hypothetical protein M2272_000683 [Mycobacterium frederiksbergense]|uniref:DUF222 domain-containing protein n=1 Tax=Mycolicibacterium frederiksbergense TaxID=117567 RepID=A0ABT6KTL1_9MYCO|nr:hypothetical protein [Mycolicibacterium frederiksbergense]